MLELPYGEGRALMGGAVYRYRCTAGEMEGSDTVVCTGAQWNTSRPHCNGRKPVRHPSDFNFTKSDKRRVPNKNIGGRNFSKI